VGKAVLPLRRGSSAVDRNSSLPFKLPVQKCVNLPLQEENKPPNNSSERELSKICCKTFCCALDKTRRRATWQSLNGAVVRGNSEQVARVLGPGQFPCLGGGVPQPSFVEFI